jgi:hypothetical protein
MNYTCPYCNQPTTITSPNKDEGWIKVDIASSHIQPEGQVGLRYKAIACPNNKCRKLFLSVKLTKVNAIYGVESDVIDSWQLLPESSAKPQPNYIPNQLVTDYNEACRIQNLSPKASAALARRCLQGMIRDFWGITKPSLRLEIDELESMVTTDVWQAIDAVRSVGNIGAHMEKDVNIIIDIEPEEADLLIRLIEDLFVDWYVVRHDRQERNARIKKLAEQKQAERKAHEDEKIT